MLTLSTLLLPTTYSDNHFTKRTSMSSLFVCLFVFIFKLYLSIESLLLELHAATVREFKQQRQKK